MNVSAHLLDTPYCPMLVVVDADGGLLRLEFAKHRDPEALLALEAAGGTSPRWCEAACAHVAGELAEYFAGERKEFTLDCRPRGTPFQRQVWSALAEIPYGRTLSYGELAKRLGRPKALRAVGRANGTNPIPIVLPCHRVIGADGSLTGYGGGIAIKRALLALEGALPAGERSQRELFGRVP